MFDQSAFSLRSFPSQFRSRTTGKSNTGSNTIGSRSHSAFLLAILSAIAGLLSGQVLFAQTTINVPADTASIQAAINLAHDGDTVLVQPGTYAEIINFRGKAITVTSSGTAPAIINGDGLNSVVTFNSGETTASVLNGFTIQNGGNYYSAGGIQITNSSPTITGNLITGNHATQGIGIDVYGGSPVIKNNTITGNTQIGSGGGGGGIRTGGPYGNPCSPSIIGNIITNNSLQGGGDGGGILINNYGLPVIQNNLIQGNYAYNSGGGISVWSNGAIISQNLILNNSIGGGGSGGGVAILGLNVSVINNTIVGNTAYDFSSGIYERSYSANTNITANNIVVAPYGQTPLVCGNVNATYPVFDHNDFFTPNGPSWSGACALGPTPVNISADPLFVDPASDFHLQAGSPAIDAGDNGVANLPQLDRDGNPRISNGNNDCISTVDLGAYELQGPPLQVSISPTSLDFGNQLVGTIGGPYPAVLTNTGASCVQLDGIVISQLGIIPDFTRTFNCPHTLLAGQSCTISVSFQPQTIGLRTAQLSVYDITGAALQSVALSGTGVAPPTVSLSATQLTFGPQPIRTTSGQNVTLTNSGSAPLSIFGIAAAAPFLQSNNCPASLVGGASCTIDVTFTSDSPGTTTGSLTITDNASGSPHSVALSGTASDFAIYPVWPAPPVYLSVKHGGSVQITVGIAPVGGAFNQSVALSCSGLPSGASCSYSPSAAVPGDGGAVSTLIVPTLPNTKRGTYSGNVVGTSGTLQHTLPFTLTVR